MKKRARGRAKSSEHANNIEPNKRRLDPAGWRWGARRGAAKRKRTRQLWRPTDSNLGWKGPNRRQSSSLQQNGYMGKVDGWLDVCVVVGTEWSSSSSVEVSVASDDIALDAHGGGLSDFFNYSTSFLHNKKSFNRWSHDTHTIATVSCTVLPKTLSCRSFLCGPLKQQNSSSQVGKSAALDNPLNQFNYHRAGKVNWIWIFNWIFSRQFADDEPSLRHFHRVVTYNKCIWQLCECV